MIQTWFRLNCGHSMETSGLSKFVRQNASCLALPFYDVAMFVTMLNVDSTDDFTLHEMKQMVLIWLGSLVGCNKT